MQDSSKRFFSTFNVIVMIALIVITLVALLFFFHMRHEEKPILANENVTLFNVARQLKDFNLTQTTHEPFKQKNLYDHWTLLFFGFTHCSEVCPNTLAMLKRAYIELKPRYPKLQVVLISLDPDRDDLNTLQTYVQQFHPDFLGVTGELQALRKLQSQFGVYAAKVDDPDNQHYQLQHTASIFLMNPAGQWAGLLRYGISPAQFVQTFEESITILTS